MEASELVLWYFMFSGVGSSQPDTVQGPFYSKEKCEINQIAIYRSSQYAGRST